MFFSPFLANRAPDPRQKKPWAGISSPWLDLLRLMFVYRCFTVAQTGTCAAAAADPVQKGFFILLSLVPWFINMATYLKFTLQAGIIQPVYRSLI
jgi:hypothetical protein